MSKKKINYLVCANSEKYSETALYFACKMAKKNKGVLTILHVIEAADYQGFGAVANTMRSEMLLEAEELLKKLAVKAQKWANIIPALIVKEGMIENEIIAVVEEDKNLSMLITGTATETILKSKILPPLVSAVGNKLMIPMMIIPGNMTHKKIDDMVN